MENKKVAIITGSSRGIGKAIALKLDKEGFITVIVSRNQEDLKKVLKEFSKNAISIKADVSKEKDVISMFKKVMNKFGRIDVVVNNAGSFIANGKKINELSKEDVSKMIDNNLMNTFYCMREAIKLMKKQSNEGQIININSIATKIPSFLLFRSVYCAVKSAIATFSENIQLEMIHDKRDIKIANIYPGFVLTESVTKTGKRSSIQRRSSQDLKKALKLEDIAYAVYMIVNQGKNSNITELVMNSSNLSI